MCTWSASWLTHIRVTAFSSDFLIDVPIVFECFKEIKWVAYL